MRRQLSVYLIGSIRNHKIRGMARVENENIFFCLDRRANTILKQNKYAQYYHTVFLIAVVVNSIVECMAGAAKAANNSHSQGSPVPNTEVPCKAPMEDLLSGMGFPLVKKEKRSTLRLLSCVRI